MTTPRNRKYKIPIDIYGAEVTLILTANPDKVVNTLCNGRDAEAVKNPELDSVYFVYNTPDSKHYTLVFPHHTDIYFIAHECFHVVSTLLFTCGSKLNKSTEEQYAYLLGFLVDKVASRFKHKRRKA